MGILVRARIFVNRFYPRIFAAPQENSAPLSAAELRRPASCPPSDFFQRVAVFGVLDGVAKRFQLFAQFVRLRPILRLARGETLFGDRFDFDGDVRLLFAVCRKVFGLF